MSTEYTAFDPTGNYTCRIIVQTVQYILDSLQDYLFKNLVLSCIAAHPTLPAPPWEITLSQLPGSPAPVYSVMRHKVQHNQPDYKTLQSLFGWLPIDVICKTFERMPQHTHLPAGSNLKQFFKSSFPALNHPSRNEDVATDTIYYNTLAIDNGSTMSQLYFGLDTHISDIYSIKTEIQFVNTLEDNICKWGAMRCLLSNRTQVEISKRVHDILHALIMASGSLSPTISTRTLPKTLSTPSNWPPIS